MINVCEIEMLWLDMRFNVKKSCLVRCGPRYSKKCVDVLLSGVPLRLCNSLKYLRIIFDVNRKLKVSLASKRMQLLRAFSYIYGCVGVTASCVVLYHLLNTFCLLILLYGLEAVPISKANLCTLQSTCNVAIYKIFKLKTVSNLYYVQYFMGTLPVNYALGLRKLNFIQKLSAHHTSVMNLLFSLTARKELNFCVGTT